MPFSDAVGHLDRSGPARRFSTGGPDRHVRMALFGAAEPRGDEGAGGRLGDGRRVAARKRGVLEDRSARTIAAGSCAGASAPATASAIAMEEKATARIIGQVAKAPGSLLRARRARGALAASTLAQSTRVAQRLPQHVLDLPVEPSGARRRPSAARRRARRDRCAAGRVASRSRCRPGLWIERARVDHRLGVTVAAQDDQQVRHHGRPPLVVELDDLVLGARCSSAISTMPTAPSTILVRAAIIACACWRCSIAAAISGA